MLFDVARSGGRKQVRVIGLNAPRRRIGAVVSVNRDEEVGLCRVGEIRALLERYVSVAGPREHYFYPQALLQQPAQTLGYVQHQIFFQQSLPSHRARVPAAMP